MNNAQDGSTEMNNTDTQEEKAELYWVSQKKLLHKSEGKTTLKKKDDLAES